MQFLFHRLRCYRTIFVFPQLGAKSITKYEAVRNRSPNNWTSALYDSIPLAGFPLARIASVDELCDAQTFISETESQYEFWTALKRSNDGHYKWGLSNESANLRNRDILLDETQPAYCYAMDKFVMKLKSKDCNSLLHGFVVYYDDDEDGKKRPKRFPSRISPDSMRCA